MPKIVLVNSDGRVIGQDHHRARLTDADVALIVQLRDLGCAWPDIAHKFGISKGQAHDYWSGRRRGHVASGQKTLAPARKRDRAAASPHMADCTTA